MARAIDQGSDEFVWPAGLDVYRREWGSRAGWHLKRARVAGDAGDKLVALREIQAASTRPWLDDDGPEELGGVAFVLPGETKPGRLPWEG